MVKIIPSEGKVNTGKSVKFTCLASGVGKNDFEYQWFMNREPVPGEDTETYEIKSVSVLETGNYSCSVKNNNGDVGRSEIAILILNGN